MDYTLSNSFATDAATTQRMHLQAQAIPTAVSDNDMNMVVWELMEIVKAGGQVGAPFDKAVPATYQKLLTALRAAGVFNTAPALDNTTKAATTAFVRAELLSLGNAVYDALFGRASAANGYQRLPGSMILQWGATGSISAGGTLVQNLPIAFPANNFAAVCMAQYSAAPNAGYMVSIFGRTLTNMSFYNSNTGTALIASWFAIGN